MPFRRKQWVVVAAVTAGLLCLALVLCSLGQFVRQPPGTGPRPAPLALGMSLGTAVYADDATLREQLAQLAGSGATWVRIDLDWSLAEPTRGEFDWGHLDRVMAAARENRLEVLGLLAYAPVWARPLGTSSHAPPVDPSTFAAFATAAAKRYGPSGVRVWEVWNEPNTARFWEPGPDPTRYAELLHAASAAVHEVDPTALVLAGGLAPVQTSSDPSATTPVDFLRAVYGAGGMLGVDGLAAHPYTFLSRSTGSDSAIAQLTDLRRLMRARGDASARVWVTEFGAPTGSGDVAVSETQQAAILADTCAWAHQQPWVAAFFVYQLRDTGTNLTDPEQNFGLRRFDGTPKPAWDAWTSCTRGG